MNYLIYILLMFMMFMSSYTKNLFFMWIILEISSLSFVIFLNIYSLKIYSIMYFLMSSISSILILFSMMNHLYFYYFNYLILFSIWLKMGMFPLNYWMNFMMKNINYTSLIPMMTMMKFIPVMIFLYFIEPNMYIIYLMMIMIMPPVLLSFNTSSFPLLMNYSSMFNIPLMLIFSFYNSQFTLIYLMIYMISTLFTMTMLNSCSIYYKNSLNMNIFFKNNFMFNTMMFLYAQLPPFTTFIMKWNLINYTMKLNYQLSFILILMTILSLLMTFNYLNFNKNNYFLNNMKIGHKINVMKKKMNISFYILILNFMLMSIYIFME